MFVDNMFFLKLPCFLSQSNFRATEHITDITVNPEKIEQSLITFFLATIFGFYLIFLGYYPKQHIFVSMNGGTPQIDGVFPWKIPSIHGLCRGTPIYETPPHEQKPYSSR